jgi:hypothetical protein
MNTTSQFPIKDWNNVPLIVYKEMLSEAKIKLDEIASQSNQITTNVIKIILVNSALIGLVSKYVIDNKIKMDNCVYLLYFIIVAYIFWNLIEIVFPRENVSLRGTSPSAFLESNSSEIQKGDSVSDYDNDKKEKVYYYLQCWRYDNSIISYRIKYSERAKKYKLAIIFTLLFFIANYVLLVYKSFVS